MSIAKLKHLRMSPRKVRLVAGLIRGLTVEEAQKQLRFSVKKAADPILKLLNSAVANARQNTDLAKENLYITKIVVEAGRPLKRWRPRAMGRATPIMKRTSHIILSLGQKGVLPQEKKISKKDKVELAEEKQELLPKEEIIAELPKKEQDVEGKKEPSIKAKTTKPKRPYSTTPQSKKKFFSRQKEGSSRKMFRRKSI
ncbi:MAG: 50S ribosomal protein L22 [Patescibacteria group bacterium]|nr:50S ribosomal protein L22 [Patescibacteria group bacterium]